ncbi:MAG: NADP-dependent oxidoreductase [Propionibacteriaceae bacterium]|nr:NADP-dependent oxidoreductase [Actinomycetota bacterium]MCW5953111.1 NADP-dependent oxidoreductase [Propionibacteriaceae bacterium]
MKALTQTAFGTDPEPTDLPLPEPGPGEVRVRVQAASVNGFDLAVAAGYLDGVLEHRFPLVLGKDFAGAVDAVGPDVTGYTVGDPVFGVVNKAHLGEGSFAEYVTVPLSGLAHIPDGLDTATAGALGLAGTAALDALDAATVRPGETVLVAGATGGVGSLVVQYAAAAGATVIATAHTDAERALVTGLGAAETVDYTQDVAAGVRAARPDGVDVVFHLAGDPATLAQAVASTGRFLSTLLQSPDQVDADGATVIAVTANPTTATLERLAQGQLDGTARVTVEHTYPLEAGAEALAHFRRGTLGKIALTTTA